MVSRERFGQGMTVQQYLDQMTMSKERFLQVLDSLAAVKGATPGRTRNVLVITEDWCGTALASFPALVRLVQERPDVQVRVFLRDENPDLMEQFLKDGKYRSIPVIVVSGERDVAERVAAAHASYVQKPVMVDRLMATMAHVVH